MNLFKEKFTVLLVIVTLRNVERLCTSCNLLWSNRPVAAFDFITERFSIECRESKIRVITATNQNTGKNPEEPMRAQSKTSKAREKTDDQFVIGAKFASNWSIEWRFFSGPIMRKVKQNQRNPRCLSTLVWKLLYTQQKITLIKFTKPFSY